MNIYTIICIAFDKPSVMAVEVNALNVDIAKKVAEHFSDMETGCGPYETYLVFNGSLMPNILTGNIFKIDNGDEYAVMMSPRTNHNEME